jgi:hypothetical protein
MWDHRVKHKVLDTLWETLNICRTNKRSTVEGDNI